MKNISNLRVKQIRIYKVDNIPFVNLSTLSSLKDFMQTFNFADIDKDASRGIRFIRGNYKIEDREYLIEDLAVEPRRIYFSMNGGSEIANLFYEDISKVIMKYDYDKVFHHDEYLVKTEDTSCFAFLDFKPEKMIDKGFYDFINKNISKSLSNSDSSASLESFILRFQFKYTPSNKEVTDYGITFSKKYLTLEPREGSRLEDMHFYTESPTDSNTHLKLLKNIERNFKKS